MVLAYHIVFTAYGFWLPNDPRGSWSTFVAAWELLLAGGKATTTGSPRSLAHDEHDRRQRLDAKSALQYPPVEFTGRQALAIANGFIDAIHDAGSVMLACSIVPGHVHLVISRIERSITTVVGHLKSRATRQLRLQRLHPFEEHVRADGSVPSCWAEGCWKVFLNSPGSVRRAIEYVEENPVKEGKPAQKWSFVTRYGNEFFKHHSSWNQPRLFSRFACEPRPQAEKREPFDRSTGSHPEPGDTVRKRTG